MQEDVVRALQRGGVVLYPTETAYALGCDPYCRAAVEKIFSIKGRSSVSTLPLIAADMDMVAGIAQMPAAAQAIARAHWPGALTLVLPVREGVGLAPGVVAQDGTIAIRVSSSVWARALASGLNAPIVSTSANQSGQPACYRVDEVRTQLGEQFARVDAVLDGGALPVVAPSTIIRVHEDGRVDVLRQGEKRPL